MARGIPRETQTFIRTHIRSIGQLEALLWVSERAGEPVTPASLAREQRLDLALAGTFLQAMEASGFVDGPDDEGAYRYRPSPPRLGEELQQLAGVYRTYRVSVINFVFSMPSESVQSFADAFKVRKEDDDR